MKIKRTKLLRLIGKKLITLPWGVYAAPKALVTEDDMIHEFIHIKQWRELWYVGFLIWYIVEFLIRLVANGFKFKKAYRSISFEREAYKNEDYLGYLKERKPFSFLNYL